MILYFRASTVRIPDVNGVPMQAKYILAKHDKGQLVDVELVPMSSANKNSDGVFYSDKLNMEITSQTGVNTDYYFDPVLDKVKEIYFGGSTKVLTKKQCEAFFEDGSKFHFQGPIP
jgi:hypothetical protein